MCFCAVVCTILHSSPDVQETQAELQKNKSVCSIMNTPDNPEQIAYEK